MPAIYVRAPWPEAKKCEFSGAKPLLLMPRTKIHEKGSERELVFLDHLFSFLFNRSPFPIPFVPLSPLRVYSVASLPNKIIKLVGTVRQREIVRHSIPILGTIP